MKSLLPLWKYVTRYKWAFAFGFVFVILANLFMVAVPIVIGDTINTLSKRAGLMGDLFLVGTFILALAGISGAFRYLMRRVLIDTSRDIEFDFRNDMYRKLQELDPAFYDGQDTGDLMSRMTNDIDSVRMMMGPAIMYSANTMVSAPLVLVAMARLDGLLTAIALVPLAVMPLIVKKMGREMHARMRAQQDQLGDLTTAVQETLAGVRVIKAYGQEATQDRRFVRENQLFIDKSMHSAILQAWVWPLIHLIAGVGMVVVLALGFWRIQSGALDVGELTTMILLFQMLMWPLIAAGWVINLFQRASASMGRILQVTETEPLVSDPEVPVALPPASEGLDVELRGLTFAYPAAEVAALHDIHLSLPSGRTIGIVGRVGSGKSTLVNLLLRQYPVERGQILIGGVDINDWPAEELRRRVGIVFQESFLFSETIAENVRFGAHDELDDDEVSAATTKAGLHEDITGFPDQYDTRLGERGVNLSGGQKQRLSIARALVRDASILVLDDALSAVDTHTEEAILASLRGEMAGRTTFLISHRISTVALADEVIVLEDGRITQRGPHEQLVLEDGLYGELHRKQLLEEEVEAIG